MQDKHSTAVHEAGHAVIGRVLGLLCGAATIVSNETKGEAGHAIVDKQWVTWEAWQKRGKFRELHSVARGGILALMAGAEAEIELLGRCAGGDGDDRIRIQIIAESADGADLSDEQWTRCEPRMRAKTRNLVRRHRAKIERVATALQERDTLQPDEIAALIADQPARFSPMPR